MYKAFIYKEWIKIRFFLIATLVACGFMAAYSALSVNRIVSLKGATHMIAVLLSGDTILIQTFRYVPVIAAILLALFQYIPEVVSSRLKLTLHLPVPMLYSTASMMTFGLAMLLCIYIVCAGVIYTSLRLNFTHEIVSHIMLTSAPWYIAGLAAYALTSWVVLEPTWRKRIVNILMSAALLRILFLSDAPRAYDRFLPALIMFTILFYSLPLLSVSRYKNRKMHKS